MKCIYNTSQEICTHTFFIFWLWKLLVFIIPRYLHVFFKIISYVRANLLFGKIVCHSNTINPSNVRIVSWNILYMTTYDKINLTTTVAILNPFNLLGPDDAYMYHGTGSSMAQVIACHLFGTEPLPEINAELSSTGTLKTNFSHILTEIHTF